MNLLEALKQGEENSRRKNPLGYHRMMEHEGGVIPFNFMGLVMEYKPRPWKTESEVDRWVNKIHDDYAKFREENADLPTHLVLSLEARQALKVHYASGGVDTWQELKEYMGIPIIELEKTIIV